MVQEMTPFPSSKPKSSPRDVFLHLLAIVTLYVSVISFIALLFQYVNVLLPDQLNSYHAGILHQIRWSTSALIVVFPVYILLSWMIERDFARDPSRRELRVRKWLLYLTLFIAAVTIIVDLITLVYNFYSGELTTRFLLKVLVVLVVASVVFGYYLWDLRRGDGGTGKKKPLAFLASAAVIAAVIAGFFIVGSPMHQRQVRFDERRVNDLQVIQNEIINYWTQKGKLPNELGDLRNSISGFTPPQDPETNEPYEYRIQFGSSLTFELCAVFKTDSSVTNSAQGNPRAISLAPYGGSDIYQQNWNHGQGRTCFTRTIDPDLYRRNVIPEIVK